MNPSYSKMMDSTDQDLWDAPAREAILQTGLVGFKAAVGGRPRGTGGGKGGGERRKRTHFSPAEVAILTDAFARDPYPGFEEREALAQRIDKPEGRVQVWFQNRRARYQQGTHPKTRRNQLVRGPGFSHQDQPTQKQNDAPLAAPAREPAAPSFIQQANQAGASWHSSPAPGREEQPGHLQQPSSLAGMGQPGPFPAPSCARLSGWPLPGRGVAGNFLMQHLQGQESARFQQSPARARTAYSDYANGYLLQPWQPNVQDPAYGVPQQGMPHCSWSNAERA